MGKKQFKRDFRICYSSYRQLDDSSNGYWNTDSWLLRIQSAYGFSDSLQASAYYGIYFFKHWFSSFEYEINRTLGMELKWRLKKRAEIYAALNYKPLVYLDVFPPFLLSIDDYSSQHHDFLGTNFGESLNIELGYRLVF